ncbi:MAG: DUF4293 domain-containing protein [Bacteroidetes bacterium]|nr:DUF4293 domain-containing protein [Bacteroidota bacterium]
MLQRIQTLYLLAAFALIILLLSFPLIYLPGAEKIFCHEVLPLLVLAAIALFAQLSTIFLYKARMIQIRISVYNTIILIGLQGWILYFFFFDRIPGATFSFTAVFPLIAAILTVLAIRYIGRDEAMIRSLNRLRK